MIRVIGFYKWQDGASFDHEYYHSKHMQITKEALLPHGLIRLESEQFLSESQPASGDIIAASNAYFANIESAQAALANAGATLLADTPNYTSLQPEIKVAAVTAHEL